MANRVSDFDAMVEAAERNGRILAPFQNNRLQPFLDKMLEMIDSGVLGKIVYVRSTWGRFQRRWDWQTLKEKMGGALMNTGPHAIDQALAIFGWDKTPEVFCRMDSNQAFKGTADDHCTVTLYDPNREAPQIDVVISQFIHFDQGGMYHVNGTCGGLVGGSDQLNWRFFDPETAPEHEMWNWSVDRRYPSEQLEWVEKSWKLDDELKKDAVGYTFLSLKSGPARFYDNLYDVIVNGDKLVISLDQVRKQVAVFEECFAQNPEPVRSTQ